MERPQYCIMFLEEREKMLLNMAKNNMKAAADIHGKVWDFPRESLGHFEQAGGFDYFRQKGHHYAGAKNDGSLQDWIVCFFEKGRLIFIHRFIYI